MKTGGEEAVLYRRPAVTRKPQDGAVHPDFLADPLGLRGEENPSDLESEAIPLLLRIL